MRTVTTEAGETAGLVSRTMTRISPTLPSSVRQRRAHAERPEEFLKDSEMDAYLAAPTPLAYWRGRRGVSQEDLARAAGISAETLAALEIGTLVGDVGAYQRLARCLRIGLDSVVPADEAEAAE